MGNAAETPRGSGALPIVPELSRADCPPKWGLSGDEARGIIASRRLRFGRVSAAWAQQAIFVRVRRASAPRKYKVLYASPGISFQVRDGRE